MAREEEVDPEDVGKMMLKLGVIWTFPPASEQ